MKLFIYFSTLLVSVLAAGDLIVMSHPKSVEFKGHERLEQTLLKEMYSAAIGLSINRGSSWSGMYIINPFNLPEAIVNVVVDGVNDLNIGIGHHFPLHTNENEEITWNALQKRIKERFPEGQNKLVRLNLDEGLENTNSIDELSDIKTDDLKGIKYLNRATDEDQNFLKELAVLNAVCNMVEQGSMKSDRSPDVFWIVITSLHPVSDFHGSNSTATVEAKQLLVESLIRLTEAFRKAYNNNALVTVVTSDASHTRFARSLKEVATDPVQDPYASLNLAKNYDPDYPVIFNIILWFGVAMFFSLLAICIVIGNMDPGRDSIIYRMTSNRMKKDN